VAICAQRYLNHAAGSESGGLGVQLLCWLVGALGSAHGEVSFVLCLQLRRGGYLCDSQCDFNHKAGAASSGPIVNVSHRCVAWVASCGQSIVASSLGR
jgi:hypothetical protein